VGSQEENVLWNCKGAHPPKQLFVRWCRENPLFKTLFEADSDPILMGQTSLKSDTLSQGKEAKNHTEKCSVSIMLCQSYSVPQGTINKNHNVARPLTDHVQAITCVTNNFSLLTHNCVENGVHFPNNIVQLWTVPNVVCVSSIRSLQDHANFELRTVTFGNLQKLSEPLRESSTTNVWTLVR